MRGARNHPRPTSGASPHTGGARLAALAGVLWQFVLVAGAAVLYFLVRGLTQGEVEVARRHGIDVLHLEAHVGLDIEAEMQRFVLDHHALVTFANWVYMWGHWPVVAATLFVLYARRRPAYLHLRNAMFVSGAIGLVIFASYPVAPPRLLDSRYVDTVTTWSNSYRVLQPPALVNRYAAVPSLHVGWNLLVGLMLWRSFRSPVVRTFAVVGPTLMCLAVVGTANHYVFDAITGAGLSLLAWEVVRRVTERLADEHPYEREVVDDDAAHPVTDQLGHLLDRLHAPHVEVAAARAEHGGELGRQAVAADAHGVVDATAMAQQEPAQLPARADRAHHGHLLE